MCIRDRKETAYGGGVRPLGNTYHFQTQVGEPFDDQAVAEYVAEQERLIAPSQLTFSRWQTWGPTDGDPVANVMRESGELSGTGSAGSNQQIYKEVCSLIVWPLPRSQPLNRRRWLRKFMRMCVGPATSLSLDELNGSAPLTQENIDALLTYANNVQTPPPLGLESSLCTKEGVEPNGDPIVRPFLVTRQIGR